MIWKEISYNKYNFDNDLFRINELLFDIDNCSDCDYIVYGDVVLYIFTEEYVKENY